MLFQDINKSTGFVQSFGPRCNFKDAGAIFINNLTGLSRGEFWENQDIWVNGLSDKSSLMPKVWNHTKVAIKGQQHEFTEFLNFGQDFS